jgi:aminopeptidase N
MIKSFCLFLCFLSFTSKTRSQSIDVQHYQYYLTLYENADSIEGKAVVTVRFPGPLSSFSLDLVQPGEDGKGMRVKEVRGDNVQAYRQDQNKVFITLKNSGVRSGTATFTIRYSGIPADGLIISKNKYGDRTFFSDNWPNRAHYWIPCNDKPSDKATVEFMVRAPRIYDVISNGIKVEEYEDSLYRHTHWKETSAIPTKVMVIGAARFGIKQYADTVTCHPVTAWVYPQDMEKGFFDFGLAPSILQFFSAYIAPYPFQKLANVQSKTIFGGMENASAIFYAENSVTGNRNSEALIAHEIAHQWFGNSATEKSFAHLWLSEGFATYLTHVYLENKYGNDTLVKRLAEDRKEVAAFVRTYNEPVVDTSSDFMELLNANSYQKGGWVLHMLRREVGDATFKKIIREYYARYKGKNADTRDFQAIAEKISARSLKPFFDQWLYTPGIPTLSMAWQERNGKVEVTIEQLQATGLYTLPLEIKMVYSNGQAALKKVKLTGKKQAFILNAAGKVKELVLDPGTNILFAAEPS